LTLSSLYAVGVHRIWWVKGQQSLCSSYSSVFARLLCSSADRLHASVHGALAGP